MSEVEPRLARRRPPEVVRQAWGCAVRHPVLTAFLVALGVRVASAVVFYIVGGKVVAVFDDSTYRQLASDMARGRADHWDAYSKTLFNSTATFTVPLTILYYVFGVHDIFGPLVSAVWGATAAALTARVLVELVDRRIALAGGLVLALLPSHVLWGSFALKDPAVLAVACGLAMVCTVTWRVAHTRRLLLWTLVGAMLLVCMAHLRSASFIAGLWAFVLAMSVGHEGVRTRLLPVLALVLLGLPLALGYQPAGVDILTTSQGTVASRREANAVGAATSFLPKHEVSDGAPAANSEYQRIQREIAEIQEMLAGLGGAPAAPFRPTPPSPTTSPPPPQVARALARLHFLEAEAERHRSVVAAAPVRPEDDALSANIRHLPRGLMAMLVDPLPWAPTETAKLRAAKAETVLWYPILTLAVVGLVGSVRRLLRVAFPLLFGGAMLLVYALAEGNFGTAYRHRSELGLTITVLAALGLADLLARLARKGSHGRTPGADDTAECPDTHLSSETGRR